MLLPFTRRVKCKSKPDSKRRRSSMLAMVQRGNIMVKEKIVLFFLLFFTMQGAKSQSLYCEIKGPVVNNSNYAYAFLVDLRNKVIFKSQILDNHFSFKVAKPKDAQLVNLFLEKDSLKTIDDFLLKNKTISTSRLLAVENAEVSIGSHIFYATVKGGPGNKEIDEMYQAMNSGNYGHFFESHPESPLALTLLKALTKVVQNPMLRGKLDLKSFYDKLSDKIRLSDDGVALLKQIEK